MATDIGAEMPAVLMARLRSARAALAAPGPENREFTAVPVCTVDAEGYPHPAMLSVGELAADDPRTLRAAVFGGSRTARHLRERGRMTLLFVEPGGTYYVKTRAAGGESPHPDAPGVAVFTLAVVAVLADAVDTAREPAAEITSGIRFTRAAPGTLL